MNGQGIIIAVVSFLCIGLFHPLVIWFEYHFTQSIWPVFLIAGLLCLIAALFIQGLFSVLLGLLGVACIWSIRELKEQARRVERGWFPKNPKRKYAGGLPISILLTECVWFYIIIPRLAMTNREVHPIMQAKL